MGSRVDKVEGARVATWIFRTCLAISVGINATFGALHPGEAHPVLAGFLHALFPFLLALTETLLVRVPNTGSRVVDTAGYVFGGAIALTAFAGSAKSLHALAVLCGFHPVWAWGVPVIVDLLMAFAMSKAVALATPKKTAKPTTQRTGVKALPNPATTKKSAVGKQSVSSGSSLSDDVAAALASDSSLTAKALAERFGVSTKTIGRTTAWKNRKNMEGAAA